MDPVSKAANAIRSSSAIVIATGAGMGVDSGLPDFRGDEGFWKAYPPFRKLGLSFVDLADPRWFADNPAQAWGFYGHRLELYRQTEPHAGYQILKQWADSKRHGCFSYTSNVDCHFELAGFAADRIVECHGSFSQLQCRQPCSQSLWSAASTNVSIEEATMLANDPLPQCPHCNQIARPNILMFGDYQWIGDRTHAQLDRFNSWLSKISKSEIVIIEIGAGTAVPSIRNMSAKLMQQKNATLIRINPREPRGPDGTISIAKPGLETLQQINELL